MTEALFFYRTPTSRIIDTPLPHNLLVAQRLNFTIPGNIWQSVDETYDNNNKKFPIATAKGVIKKLGVSPAGMKGYQRIIRGYFKDDASAAIDQLRAMRKVGQIDSYHEFGAFGMDFGPEASTGFGLVDDGDPDDTFGWTFDSYTLQNKSAFSNKVYDFSITLGFGGTLP